MCDHPLRVRREWVDFKNPDKSLAWIDLCALSYCEICYEDGPTPLDRGEIEVSYAELAKRWSKEKGTVARWIKDWQRQRKLHVIAEPKSQGATGIYQVLEYAENKQPNLLSLLDAQ